MDALQMKKNALITRLSAMGRVAVAFSGGVDSTFLLAVAYEILGDQVLAVTARSPLFPARELAEAAAFTQARGIRHKVFDTDEFAIDGFAENPPNRCYLCKHALFSRIFDIAAQDHVPFVLEGANVDDMGDYRPGMAAVKALGAHSPLLDAGLTKDDIRRLSRDMGLPTWHKPSFACLASRFVYGETITRDKLNKVGLAEQYLLDKGLTQVRVRIHGDLARIEIIPEEWHRLTDEATRCDIYAAFKSFGFGYTALDLQGYRTGSMNESLSLAQSPCTNSWQTDIG